MQNRKCLLIPAIMIVAGVLLITKASANWLLIFGFVVVAVGIFAFVYLLNCIYQFIKIDISIPKKRNSRNKQKQHKTNAQKMNGFEIPNDVVTFSNTDTAKTEVVEEPKYQIQDSISQPLVVNLKNRIFECDKYKLIFECNNSNAVLYCSVDGNSYKKYDAQIIIDSNCEFSIYAELNGQKSNVLEERVDVFKVKTPIITLSDRTICIRTDTSESQIYYTLDGKEPSISSSLYKGVFPISKSCIIKAFAIKERWNNSEVASLQVNIIPTKEERVRKYTDENNVIGISYRGDSHIKTNNSCQDCHCFERINNEWNVAIVSDGAGSAKYSDEGSRAVCAAFTYYIKNMIETDANLNNGNILDPKTWDIEFRGMLSRFQLELRKNLVKPDMPFESFAATIIMLVFSSKGYMVAHVGDGRAGIKVNGEWRSIITPHKGEEANQTIFSTSKYFGEKYMPSLKMSNVYVPETDCSNLHVEAFVLMSDGCENGAWMTYQRKNLPNGDFRVEDVNLPRSSSLDQCMQIIDLPNESRKMKLIDFITESSNAFINEPDDKTILIGRVK